MLCGEMQGQLSKENSMNKGLTAFKGLGNSGNGNLGNGLGVSVAVI